MPRPTRKCVVVFYFRRFQFILHLNIYIKHEKIWHAHVVIFTGQPMLKKLQIIENVLNTPWPLQPMRIWPDPLQTTLKANQTLNFTTNLNINRNIHDAGKLLFTHTPESMIRFRKNYFLFPGNPIYNSAICGQGSDTLIAPYSLVNQC